MQRFGEKLRTLRRARGLTMRELAEALDFQTHSFIGQLESGHRFPSLELAVKIANYFGVTVDQLAKDELEID